MHVHDRRSCPAVTVRPSRLGLAVAAVALLAATPAAAVTIQWIDPAGGSAGSTTNWNPAQVPAAADDLVWNIAGTYGVSFPGTVPASRSHTYRQGTVTLTCTAPHAASTNLVFGSLAGDNATTTLTTGSLSSAGSTIVGSAGGSSGTLTVTTDDAELHVTGATADLIVGSSGNGTLNVTSGGVAQVADDIVLGNGIGSAGTAVVDGIVSSGGFPPSFAPSTLYTTGAGGDILVGNNGTATMTISNGAIVESARDVKIAVLGGGNGTVTLSSAVSFAGRLLAAGSLYVNRDTAATAPGGGRLNIHDGGYVDVAGTTFIGDPDGSGGAPVGILQMTGDGQLETGSLIFARGSWLFDGGEVRVLGGTLDVPGDDLTLGSTTGDPVELVLDGASTSLTRSFGDALRVGALGPATLRVVNGGSCSIFATAGSASDAEIGGPSGGTVVVDTSSSMTVNRNLDLGGSGFGTLTVGTGSTLNLSNLFTSGGSTSATISGTGARLDAANSISVGAGSLTATNGGLIEAATVTNAAALAVLGTTSSMTVTGTITNSGTVSLTGGQITAGTLDFNGLGSPTGHGTVAARILNDSITSDIVASGGTLNLGNAADTAGFLNVGDLVVGTLTVNVFDANTALLGDVSIAGGRLTVPNGGTLVAGDVLTGRGRIDGSLTNGGTISSVGGELQFSGLLAGTGTGCSGLRFRFLTGGGFTGAGTIDAEVHGDAGTTITPTGALTLGTLSSTGGIALQGSLAVESHAVTLRDADLATLGNVTMATGTLSMPNGGLLPAGKSISGKGLVQGDLTNTGSLVSSGDGLRFSGLLLGVGQGITGDKVTFLSGGGFRGSGAIGCELDSDAGSTVTATGNLSAGLANHFNGVVLDGTLEVGPHVVTLLDANGLNLGSRTEIDAGELVSAVALVLPSTRRVEGRGTVDAPSFENRGVVAPALGANAETGRFDFAGSWTQTATGRLEIDIAGTIPDDEHDQLDVAGTATLAGTLAIEFLPGFSASHGQQILVLVSNGLTGTFPTVTTSGLPFGFAALVSYTATDVLVEIVADTDGDGSPDATDCAPSNAGAFAVPGAVPDLRALDAQTFAWTSAEAGAGAATVHDVVRGDALALPVGGASEVCLAPGTPAATAVDPDEPLVGEAFYYLVRGRNACGEGSWGTDGAGTPRETAVCP